MPMTKNSLPQKPHSFSQKATSVFVLGMSLAFLQTAEAKSTVKTEKAAKSVSKKDDGKSSLLWNSWYTMTVKGKIPFGYYNDRVEKKDGKFAYQNQLWKKEEGFINEERVVSFAKDNETLSPILFNFLATYRDAELVIDGTFSGTELVAKIRRNKKSVAPIRASVPSKAFLSTLFQVWMGRHLDQLVVGKSLSFVTLFEDALDSRFSAVNGSVTLEKDDELATKTKSKKIAVVLSEMKSTWYLLPSGEAVRIEKPDQDLVIERKTESEALHFLSPRVDKE